MELINILLLEKGDKASFPIFGLRGYLYEASRMESLSIRGMLPALHSQYLALEVGDLFRPEDCRFYFSDGILDTYHNSSTILERFTRDTDFIDMGGQMTAILGYGRAGK